MYKIQMSNARSLRVMLEHPSAKGLYREVSPDEMLKHVQHDIVPDLPIHKRFRAACPNAYRELYYVLVKFKTNRFFF